MKTLIIVSHPNLENSCVNKALLNVAKAQPDVTIRHIEAIYGSDTTKIDPVAEAAQIAQAERIVFQFPLYWLSTPPMMKAYLDTVFSYCHQNGRTLESKELQIAVSTGTGANEYSKYGSVKFTLSEILVPLKVTADYSGMTFNRIFVTDGSLHGLNAEQIAIACDRYGKLLRDELDEDEED